MPLPDSFKNCIRLPLIGAPMFIVSVPELVLAQCKSGIVGSFPALNARPQSMLDEWLYRISEELDDFRHENPDLPVAPYAVNQIAHASNDRLEDDVKACIKHKVPIIITSLRPPAELVNAVHEYGGVVFHDVINLRHARKAIEQGVDGIIAVCAGAGGHAGTSSPFALVKEIRDCFDGTIILSGSMSNGNDILAAQAIGADLAYIGTRFIATEEANAPAAYKEMIVKSSANDIVYTSLFSGVHGSYLRGSISNLGLDPDDLPEGDKSKMDFGSGGGSKAKVWKDIWSAGQGVGSVHDIPPVGDLVQRMEQEYHNVRKNLKIPQLPSQWPKRLLDIARPARKKGPGSFVFSVYRILPTEQAVISRSIHIAYLFRPPGPVKVNFNSFHSRQAFTNGVIDEWKKRLYLLF